MQQRLPDVGQPRINQCNPGFLLFAELVSQPGHQLKAAGATADNHDVMWVFHNARILLTKTDG